MSRYSAEPSSFQFLPVESHAQPGLLRDPEKPVDRFQSLPDDVPLLALRGVDEVKTRGLEGHLNVRHHRARDVTARVLQHQGDVRRRKKTCRVAAPPPLTNRNSDTEERPD